MTLSCLVSRYYNLGGRHDRREEVQTFPVLYDCHIRKTDSIENSCQNKELKDRINMAKYLEETKASENVFHLKILYYLRIFSEQALMSCAEAWFCEVHYIVECFWVLVV